MLKAALKKVSLDFFLKMQAGWCSCRCVLWGLNPCLCLILDGRNQIRRLHQMNRGCRTERAAVMEEEALLWSAFVIYVVFKWEVVVKTYSEVADVWGGRQSRVVYVEADVFCVCLLVSDLGPMMIIADLPQLNMLLSCSSFVPFSCCECVFASRVISNKTLENCMCK